MPTTTRTTRRAVNPRLPMTEGQRQTVQEAYTAVFGGKEAADDRYIGGASALLPLRVAARAMLAGVPKAKVVALYTTLLATVQACYPDDADALTIRDLMLAEQRANYQLDREQLTLGDQPSRGALLTLDRCCDEQIAATIGIKEKVARLLGRAQDIVRSARPAERSWT